MTGRCGPTNCETQFGQSFLWPSARGAMPWPWRPKSSTGSGNAERVITAICCGMYKHPCLNDRTCLRRFRQNQEMQLPKWQQHSVLSWDTIVVLDPKVCEATKID